MLNAFTTPVSTSMLSATEITRSAPVASGPSTNRESYVRLGSIACTAPADVDAARRRHVPGVPLTTQYQRVPDESTRISPRECAYVSFVGAPPDAGMKIADRPPDVLRATSACPVVTSLFTRVEVNAYMALVTLSPCAMPPMAAS